MVFAINIQCVKRNLAGRQLSFLQQILMKERDLKRETRIPGMYHRHWLYLLLAVATLVLFAKADDGGW
jgi:hypothetical protein